MIDAPLISKVLDLHDALDRANIAHAFGGALALALHVEQPRATADIDVNISVPTSEAASVLAALPEHVAHGPEDLVRIEVDGQVRVFWGRTPLDLFFPQHLLHAVIAGRTVSMTIGGGAIPVLSATDLTIFKALFDRTKDWADIEEMVAFGSPDVEEALAWLVELLGPEDRRVHRLREVQSIIRRADPTWRDLRP